ncbi:helix-turn-helix domain-containing protein [Paraperlucidibaca wandonensis]|jgi:CRP/FNR family transcriptional regulator|uniref:Helix-turn-helix domain-containing protein n=1 Tax=Paraperlucidibaca wandonensis TaxID=1268273 RepID=A0ABW3HJQ4_9GAMM|nr:helix-turn-helix domain-containing protein [Paraperlucidibaca sp.]MBQ0841474.1 helix-turn-helix domain-containing protein [Paraperlucidibaca sp.]
MTAFRPAATRCLDCGLHKLCFPPSFDEHALNRISQLVAQPSAFAKNETVYRLGDSMTALYAVRSGALKTSVLLPSGEEQITGFYLPGEVIGLDNMGQSHCASTATALEKTTLCELPVNGISQLSQQLPELQGHLFQIMSTELRQDYQRMHLMAQASAEVRVVSFLLGLSARQQQRHLATNELRLSMGRADLANHLGLALETVSRALSQLADDGLIEVSGKSIRIIHAEQLAERVAADCHSS